MKSTTDTRKIGQALQWIVSLLDRHEVPYQIVGGLAAQAYGARRPLVDIDLYVPMEKARLAFPEMEPYLVRRLLPNRGQAWNLTYLALNYQEVLIELGDSSGDPRFYNSKGKSWESQIIDYAASEVVRLHGVEVKVMSREELIRYKTLLDREVDRADLREMLSSPEGIKGEDSRELSPTIEMSLEFAAFDDRSHDELLADLERKGFRLTSLEELGNTEEAQRKLYVLNDTTAMQEAGSDGEHAWPSFEVFRDEICAMEWFKPGGQLVAIDGATGTWAAMNAITRFGGSDRADVLHAGVDLRYAGLKLAEALMVLAIRHARDQLKAQSVHVEIGKLDSSMISLCRELGFS